MDTPDKEYAKSLKTPDGSRCILDTEAKFSALRSLSVEMDDLLRQVGKEQSNLLAQQELPSLNESRAAVGSLYVP